MLLRVIGACWLVGSLLLTPAVVAESPASEPAVETSERAHTPPTLPDDLVWETNERDPLFADPNAERGGLFRSFVLSFPLTLRVVGPDSNGSFAGLLRPLRLSFGLVDMHPNTRNPIPLLATHWAFADDNRTVYFKLDPDARWSDGTPITADDFLFTLEFMRSPHIVAPWYNHHFTEQIVDVTKFDDHTISVTSGPAKPRDELLFNVAIAPTPRHFHTLDENWVRDYNWRWEPTIGAYEICKVRKGRYIEFCRVDNWWGDDKRYLKHRFNPERVRIKVIRDINIAWNYFLKGELDTFGLTLPRFWHKKSAVAPNIQDGYIRRIKFYNDVPQPAYGMYLNMDDPLLRDRNVRLGLAHSMNIQKVIDTVLRGDYERLETHHVGYGEYTNTAIEPRAFDLRKAAEYFTAAGWGERGPDGIRVKDGRRLSLRITYGQSAHTQRLVVLKEEAKKAGVELELQLMDNASTFKQILEKKHQIAWMAWSGGGIAPVYRQHYHSDNAHKPQTNNITNFDDPEMDRMIEEYRNTLDKQRRVELAHQLEQKVHDSGAMIPTFKVPYTREAYWRWLQLPPWYGTRMSDALFDVFGLSLFWIDPALKEATQQARREDRELPPVTIIDTTYRVQ